jgi:hypothetical protein
MTTCSEGIQMALNKTNLRSFCVLVVFTTCQSVWAGSSINSNLLWSENDVMLVIARVVDDGSRVLNADNVGGNAFAVLEPLALLAGPGDPSATPNLKVTFYYGPGAENIHDIPPKGALILAVVMEKNFIISDTCTFMPEGSPLVVLNGFGDRKITDTIDRLRKVRLASPATQPAVSTTRPAAKG